MTTAAQRFQYSYTEPHPSVSKPTTLHTGRGGAGNSTRLCPTTATSGPTATGPPSRSPLASPSLNARRFSSGRGGAGNVKTKKQVAAPGEPTVYELEREARLNHEDAIKADKRVWHYGRGGEGNLIDQTKANKDAKSIASVSERRGSNESVISSGSSLAGDSASSRAKKSSRASSFAEKVATKLGARKNSKGSPSAAEQ